MTSHAALELASFLGAFYAAALAAHALLTGQATTRAIGQPAETISITTRPLSFLLHVLFHASAAAIFLTLGLTLRSDAPPWVMIILRAVTSR